MTLSSVRDLFKAETYKIQVNIIDFRSKATSRMHRSCCARLAHPRAITTADSFGKRNTSRVPFSHLHFHRITVVGGENANYCFACSRRFPTVSRGRFQVVTRRVRSRSRVETRSGVVVARRVRKHCARRTSEIPKTAKVRHGRVRRANNNIRIGDNGYRSYPDRGPGRRLFSCTRTYPTRRRIIARPLSLDGRRTRRDGVNVPLNCCKTAIGVGIPSRQIYRVFFSTAFPDKRPCTILCYTCVHNGIIHEYAF